MGIENGGILLAEFGPDRVPVPLDLTGRIGHGVLQPGELRVDRAPLNEAARDSKALAVEDKRFTDRDAG
jgi:hypothetical protein